MIAAHMRANTAMWDTPSDWVHDAIRVFHVILTTRAIEALGHRVLKEHEEFVRRKPAKDAEAP